MHLAIACSLCLLSRLAVINLEGREEHNVVAASTSGFVAAVLSPLVSWAELLHYTKLHAAVPKWLPLRFRLCGVREVSTGRKYVLLRMHTD